MELFRKWLHGLRRLLAFAKWRIFGWSLFSDGHSGVGEASAPVKSPRGPAPRRGRYDSRTTISGRSYLDQFARLREGADHPAIERLRRKAVNELFDWLGLVLIPRQTWPILERVGDPGASVEQLILGLGCDPKRARRRDANEIARLQVAIDTLIALDTLRPHLSPEHLQEIECFLFSGEYETVKSYSRIVSALSAVLLGRDKSASLRLFAVYKEFITDIERYVRDPLSLQAGDADEALRVSDGFITAMENYTALHEDVSGMIGAVLADWPGYLGSGHDFDLRNGMILRFEEIDETLLSDAALGLAQIETLIEECSLLLQDLEGLLDRIRGGHGPDGPARMSELDTALDFFGFAAGSAPRWSEIQRVYWAIMKNAHPDLAAGITDADEIARREDLAQKANSYRDLLRRHGFATT